MTLKNRVTTENSGGIHPFLKGHGDSRYERNPILFAPCPLRRLVVGAGCRIFGQNGSTDPSHIGDPDGGVPQWS